MGSGTLRQCARTRAKCPDVLADRVPGRHRSLPWWPADRNEMTPRHILVRVATDTSPHAGQADIIRELIDGTVGRTSESLNMPPGYQAWWQSYRDQVERAAREAAINDRGPQR